MSRKLPPVPISDGAGQVFHDFRSSEAQQIPVTTMDLISRFVARVRALETALGRDLFLAGEVAGISRLGSLGVGRRLMGLDGRPQLGDVLVWAPVVLEWSRQFDDSMFLLQVLL